MLRAGDGARLGDGFEVFSEEPVEIRRRERLRRCRAFHRRRRGRARTGPRRAAAAAAAAALLLRLRWCHRAVLHRDENLRGGRGERGDDEERFLAAVIGCLRGRSGRKEARRAPPRAASSPDAAPTHALSLCSAAAPIGSARASASRLRASARGTDTRRAPASAAACLRPAVCLPCSLG